MKPILVLLLIYASFAHAQKYEQPPQVGAFKEWTGQRVPTPVPPKPLHLQVPVPGMIPQIQTMPNLQPLGTLLTIDPRVFLPPDAR